jgi:hypothetical protein
MAGAGNPFRCAADRLNYDQESPGGRSKFDGRRMISARFSRAEISFPAHEYYAAAARYVSTMT